MSYTGYIRPAFVHYGETVQTMVKAIKECGLVFDAIAVRGTSGLLIGPQVAYELGLGLIIVRKPDATNHTNKLVEINETHPEITKQLITNRTIRYAVIDDCVSTGKTLKQIQLEINKAVTFPNSAKMDAVFLYYADACAMENKLREKMVGCRVFEVACNTIE